MSSDSEDDCYGNIAQRLQTVKNAFKEDEIDSTNLLIKLQQSELNEYSWKKNNTTLDDCDTSHNSGTADDISLDTIIANNSKKRATRAAKRAADVDTTLIVPEKKTRAKRTKKNEAADAASTSQDLPLVPEASTASKAPIEPVATESSPSIVGNANSVLESSQTTRGRGRGRGGARQARGGGRRQTSIQDFMSPRRARGRRGYWAQEDWNDPSMYDLALALAASTAMMNGRNQISNNGQIISVGNTDEYPDQCDDQPLFSSAPKPQSDVVIIENDQELEDNEELSIKVYWQSSEVVKFNLRGFQRLKPIFDHFAQREKVPHDKLLFTYNDKILKSDDTPNSINYSFVKFIDGGVINQSVSSIIQDSIEDGIKLKFQCQNVKKPFTLNIRPEEKLQVVMMKCSEHLEKPLDKLKFYFDGDLISGKNTAQDLELEGGECIDVTVIS